MNLRKSSLSGQNSNCCYEGGGSLAVLFRVWCFIPRRHVRRRRRSRPGPLDVGDGWAHGRGAPRPLPLRPTPLEQRWRWCEYIVFSHWSIEHKHTHWTLMVGKIHIGIRLESYGDCYAWNLELFLENKLYYSIHEFLVIRQRTKVVDIAQKITILPKHH